MLIRPTLPGDVPQILALIGGIYAEYGCTLDAENEERHLLEPGPYFRAEGGEFWVVEEGGKVRATVAVKLHPGSAELKSLYVHPEVRRRGWGRKLVGLVIEHARRNGRKELILWSDTRFLDAHRLYRSLGFRRGGERDLKDSNNSREYGFHLSIDGTGGNGNGDG